MWIAMREVIETIGPEGGGGQFFPSHNYIAEARFPESGL
jgi:hypothetical protein